MGGARRKPSIDLSESEFIGNDVYGKTPDIDDTNNTEIIDNDGDTKVKDWISLNSLDLQEIKCTLYKFDNTDGGTERAQIGVWRNSIPDTHEIGLKHGAGRYIMVIVAPKTANRERKITTRQLKLHENYNQLMIDERKKQYTPENQNVPVQNNADSMKYVMSLIENIFRMITPLMVHKNNGNGNGGDASLLNQYAIFQNMLKASTKENINFYSDMQRRIMDSNTPITDMEDRDTPDEKPTIIQQLIPLIQSFVPLLLKKDKSAELTLETIKRFPQFKQITENTEDIKKLISFLDKAYGKNKTDTILKKFNVQRV